MKTVIELVADSSSGLRRAEDRIKDRLFSSPWFCYKYQLHRLLNIRPEEVGVDLAGSAEGGIIYYPPNAAAELLCVYSGNKCACVGRLRRDFPYTEGNLSFSPFTEAFLPGGRPVLFRGKQAVTVDQLAEEQRITLDEAANRILEIVENE